MEAHESLTKAHTGESEIDRRVTLRQVALVVLDERALQRYNSTPPEQKDMLALDPEKGIIACWERAEEAVKADKGSVVWYVHRIVLYVVSNVLFGIGPRLEVMLQRE